jgi:hypothetical protein
MPNARDHRAAVKRLRYIEELGHRGFGQPAPFFRRLQYPLSVHVITAIQRSAITRSRDHHCRVGAKCLTPPLLGMGVLTFPILLK